LWLQVAEDAVLFWNGIALDSVALDIDRATPEAPGPVLGARALGMVHLAIAEAYNASSDTLNPLPTYLGTGNGPTNLPPRPTPPPSSNTFNYRLPAIAATGAAHAVLTGIFTAQRQLHDAALEQARAAFRSSESAGLFEVYLAFGREVGQRVLLLRRDDPVSNILEDFKGFTPELYDGGYQPAPGGATALYAPRYGNKAALFSSQKRYALREPTDFLANNTVLKDDVEYLNWKGIEESQLGSIPGDRRRTEEETRTGIYWAYDGPKRLGTPPRQYNQVGTVGMSGL
jgi:vanadium chloroperoxidase